MTAAVADDLCRNTDRELAGSLVERVGLTHLVTESRYREPHAEWIRRNGAGHVTRLADDTVAKLAEALLKERGQGPDRVADVVDYAQIIAHEWVPVRDRHFGEPWPGDFDDDPVADLAGAAAYVAKQGDLTLPFMWPLEVIGSYTQRMSH